MRTVRRRRRTRHRADAQAGSQARGPRDRVARVPEAVVAQRVPERDRPGEDRIPALPHGAGASPEGPRSSDTPGCGSPHDEAHVTNVAVHPDARSVRRGHRVDACARRRGDSSRVRRMDARGPSVERGCAGAVPQLRLRACRCAQELLRERRGRHRHVVPRHPGRRVRRASGTAGEQPDDRVHPRPSRLRR